MDNKELSALDKKHVWHPFTQMKEWVDSDPLIISSGKGCYIKDINGRWYLDGVSSLWVNIFGHRRQEINEAIKGQLDRIAHSTLLGLSGDTSIRLAERLCILLNHRLKTTDGNGLNKVFYSDNGSTAVEVGLKMAFQYWINSGISGRDRFISLNQGYHGDTLGAVSVGGIDIFHSTFGALLFPTYKSPSPFCYRCELGLDRTTCSMSCLDKMEELLKEHSKTIAGVIVEPMVQGVAGMRVAPAGFLLGVRELCTKYNTIMIVDEVATGFGRTGRMFACEHEGVVPDIICLSKGITGGYMPLAVTIAGDNIYQAFMGETRELIPSCVQKYNKTARRKRHRRTVMYAAELMTQPTQVDDRTQLGIKTFFHGHSYTGNPLACAAALACLDIFERDDIINKLVTKIGILDRWLKKISGLKHVGDARHLGLMAGVELVMDKETKKPYPYEQKMGYQVTDNLREKGVILRPIGNVIIIMPPLTIKDEELSIMLDLLESAIIEVTE